MELTRINRCYMRRNWSVFLIVIMVFSLFPSSLVHAADSDDTNNQEDEFIKQHELFEFEASIKHSDISDGTAPFDANNQPGNDAAEHNQIVRSWDTVTYPIKMTVNPKNADMLENIKIRLSGTLENGITEDRVNANFAIGGHEDMKTKKVIFEQFYTIERTGNSVMIPVTVEVKGAKPGVKLTPEIKVQIISVDGESIQSDNVTSVFNQLPSVTVSAKVNIKPYVRRGLAGSGYPYMPYSKMIDGGSEEYGVDAFAISWGIDNLPGKSGIRGSTFPDSDGKINFSIELYGKVYWDNKPIIHGSERFDFKNGDIPIKLFDHRPISNVRSSVGSANTLRAGQPYRFTQADRYVTANSSMPDYDEQTLARHSYNSVWDSGEWSVQPPNVERYTVTYKGMNTDFKIGSTFPIRHAYVSNRDRYVIFGVNEKIFSTHAFLVDMQNEYRVGAENNPNNYTNNVYYRAKVTLDNYTDEDGNVTEFNKSDTTSTVLRNGTGGMAAYGTYRLYPGRGYVSPQNPYNYSTSVGDASILTGQDVYFTPRLNPNVNLYGGYKGVYRWNTDAFELTEQYAKEAKRNILARGYRNLEFDWVKYDRENQKISYGVAKFSDNSFDSFTSKGIDDYTWYKTYDKARDNGIVGAILSDVQAKVGGIKSAAVRIPLRVKHDNIGFGSVTKDGTPVICVVNAYVYLDEEREIMKDVTKNRTYGNYSKWDDAGNLLKMQSPVGGGTNFDTLAVVPAKTSTSINADDTTYYNSETIHWTNKSSIVLPEYGVPSDMDAGITIKQTLPKGLDYKTGSGEVGGVPTEPEIIENDNGTTTLVWDLLVSNSTRSIATIEFDTTINPFALDTGVQSSVTVKSVISSELDGGPIDARTATEAVTILKVGMVGIYESINKIHGDKNSDYTVTLSPYTTIEDEENVTGLTHLPLSGDSIGSDYSGTVELKAIDVQADREHEDQDVAIYLNPEPIYSDAPHEIDVSQNGWTEYTGDTSQLEDAVSILFIVEGRMTNHDTIKINLMIQTNNNEFGDKYLNRTVINSDTDYRLSPVSNRVRYTIRADLELALERFQIYTNKASLGLPTSIRVDKTVLDRESVAGLPITLAIYETESGDKVASKTYTLSELKSENEIKIPSDGLVKGSHKNYTVKIEGFDTNKIWVKDGEGVINTDGYTSIEGTLTEADVNANGKIKFSGIVMTERELGQEMQTYAESVVITSIPDVNVKSGYGYEINPNVTYSNELMSAVQSQLDVSYSVDTVLNVDNNLIDKTLAFYNTSGETSAIPLLRGDNSSGAEIITTYQFPQMYLEQGTGFMYTANQQEDITGEPIDAGHKLYVPVWISDTGAYDTRFKSKEPLGVHRMDFNILNKVNVIAYMFSHTNSDTPIKDELLIKPIEQDEIPDDW